MHHGSGERFRVLLAGKIQPIHELGVSPLVERGRCLVVLEAFDDGTVYDDFVVLQLATHYPECVVLLVVKDLHLAQPGRTARWNPLLLAIVVHHHRSAGSDYALFAHHSRIAAAVASPCSENTEPSVSVCVLLLLPYVPNQRPALCTRQYFFPKQHTPFEVVFQIGHSGSSSPLLTHALLLLLSHFDCLISEHTIS